nr:hypothetical protein [Candidatus Sigynarchaeum springense]MDO8119405.1 hypothetical protein [Candidatus Sigynarchaeota archaeon]
MAGRGSKTDVESVFRNVIITKHPSASFSYFNAKRLSDNTRILLPSNAGRAASDKGIVLKLKKVIQGTIPRSKFVPLLISTRKRGTYIMAARLTPHGGEIAVEIARKLSRDAMLRLIVLGTNVIALLLVDAALALPGNRIVEESIEKLGKITNDFHDRIETLLSK